jgi:SWI/SNF-related matrix-associated actin-dependent regulator 1 of chromatin subfamily A
MNYGVERSWATEPLFGGQPHRGIKIPKPYQFAGAEYALARDHCLVADQMGLGKSCEAMLIDNSIEAGRTLIICPASLRLNWIREIRLWTTRKNPTICVLLTGKDDINLDVDFLIVSYSLLLNDRIHGALLSVDWDHIVMDEAHALKDPTGNQRTKAICGHAFRGDWIPGVIEDVGRMTLMTGTPMPNQPLEVYNAIAMLDWSAIDYMSLGQFREEYYTFGGGFVTIGRGKLRKMKWSHNVRNVPTNLDDLQQRLRSSIMVRRLKADVLADLPQEEWIPFPLIATGKIRKALKHEGWKQAERMYEMDAHAFDAGIPVDGAISTARRELGEAKAPLVIEYVEQLLSEGAEKIVVAAWHRSVLALLYDKLKAHNPVYLDGGTTPRKKQEAVDAFQQSDDIRLIIGQTLTIGEGHTLTVAQDVVLAEPDWVPGKNDQVLSRIARLGQEGAYCRGHIPVVPDTLDERILGTSIRKDKNIHAALDLRDSLV